MSSHEQHGFGDRRLMGPVSGFLWLTAAAAAIVCQLLPGTPREHPFIVWGLIALVLVYGVACVRSWIAWERMTLTHHSIAVIAFQPLIALGLWVSGGVDSYLGPILALPTIYVAYFFPPRLALPLGLLEIATFFSPVVYTADAEQHLMLERTVAYAAAYAGLTFTIQLMTRRLAAAEAHQRRMAHEDPLTGLPNRRAFDRALDGALAGEDRFALLLIDVDHFKAINDTFGHVVGDEVLCALAERVRGRDPRLRHDRSDRRRRAGRGCSERVGRRRRAPGRRSARGRRRGPPGGRRRPGRAHHLVGHLPGRRRRPHRAPPRGRPSAARGQGRARRARRRGGRRGLIRR
jgi:hypothetical protein